MEATVRELFIYYRSTVQQAERVLRCVGEFQAGLAQQRPALTARLLRRPEVQSGQITWMETYSINDPLQHPDGVDAELWRDIEAAAWALRDVIDGERHIEVFETCAS
jgi:hypothetical protein